MRSHVLFVGVVVCTFLFPSCKKKDCPEISKGTTDGKKERVFKSVMLKPGTEGKDAQVNSISPDNNYAAYGFGVLHAMAGTWSGTPGAIRIYMQFDYSSIPAKAEVESVKLKLYADTVNVSITGPPKGHTSLTGPNEIYVKRVISPWSETTLTWNTQPSTDNVNRLELPASTSRSQAYTIDITKFAQDEMAEPTKYHGIMIQMKDETPWRAVAFRSSDDTLAARRPELHISYWE